MDYTLALTAADEQASLLWKVRVARCALTTSSGLLGVGGSQPLEKKRADMQKNTCQGFGVFLETTTATKRHKISCTLGSDC